MGSTGSWPQPQQPQPLPPSTDTSISTEKDWIPSVSDSQQLDSWFRELDDGTGFVGGANIVQFLKNTNFSTELLRTVWALVDSSSTGKINRYQFYKIIRLLSIASSPIYAGSAPSMERYFSTTHDTFPLPTIKTSEHLDPVQPALEVEWIPQPEEKAVIDTWFASLDSTAGGVIGGAAAAGFLKGTGLDREVLRSIWSLVDTANKGSIDRKQFYKIIRLVSISCHPSYTSGPPSLDIYKSTLALTLPLPQLSVSTVTTPTVPQHQHQPQTQPYPVAPFTPGVPGGGLLGAPTHVSTGAYPPQPYGAPSYPPQPTYPPHTPLPDQAYQYQQATGGIAAPVTGASIGNYRDGGVRASGAVADPDDDFSDFSVAPTEAAPPVLAPAHGLSTVTAGLNAALNSSTGTISAISALDDLGAEFSDFKCATQAAVATALDVDPFGLLPSAADPLQIPFLGPTTTAPRLTSFVASGADDDDDEMGDFLDASSSHGAALFPSGVSSALPAVAAQPASAMSNQINNEVGIFMGAPSFQGAGSFPGPSQGAGPPATAPDPFITVGSTLDSAYTVDGLGPFSGSESGGGAATTDDEMGDFMDAGSTGTQAPFSEPMSASTSASMFASLSPSGEETDMLGAPVTYSSTIGSANDRMHFFDDLAEADLTAER